MSCLVRALGAVVAASGAMPDVAAGPADPATSKGNLFDTRYISTTIITDTADAASALFSPGTGRAIYGGVRYRL